ncbi:GNAT family N-acetyltransferase [Afifella pfennigii]|uniref:GNAT family N-acetyltransferase n=1 Tax=Afifella pfennigii TaxID=209897 RepID=UPI00047AE427|nr:GNAT family N-acetyltransferase [Afifella pfennigii]
MGVAIRPLRQADRPGWEPLWQGYLDFYQTALAPQVTEGTWARLLQPETRIHGLGAFLDGGERLVGIVHYLFHPVTWSLADRCYLEDLFVAEEARGRGAGRALIEAVYAAADKEGADQVYWLTQDFNHDARRLYDSLANLTPFIKYRR